MVMENVPRRAGFRVVGTNGKSGFLQIRALWPKYVPWRCAVGFQSVPRTPMKGFQPILCGFDHFLVDSERKIGF